MGYIENLRKIVGNQPLILVGVAVAVINDKDQILLQKRSDGVWGVPGGFMELGESTEEAGRREVFEETGIEVGNLDLVGVFSGKQHHVTLPNGDEFYPVTIAYVTKDIKNDTIKIDSKETLEAKFFKVNELPEGLSPLIRNMIKQYLLSL
ncbi:NUDIX hydrolase [Ferdinandcohnia quinoae]|uniref:NUDIX hydrolase n=1 Tax=Fredinandcohnia quinoae TaxID=2918902 RepID=A0AAW5DW49_9BACI|nr:NUDIX hydrolase [Fredinandcohnia sp. SECRCQ15]MCH1624856.1 NUDIX hydrolase [Fredinandcohnia sp. SECRCQ15]